MRATVWVALRSMVIGVLIVGMTVPLALAGRRRGCSPCYAPSYSSSCYSGSSCYSYAGDCSSYVVEGGCSTGGCSVGGGHYYAPVTNCPNCIAPTHPDVSVIDGHPPVKYTPPVPAPAPLPGSAAGAPRNDVAPPPNNNNNFRPAPAPMEQEPAPPPRQPAPAPMPAPEAVPPKPPADDPFGAPGAAAPKPNNNNVVAPAVLEEPKAEAPAAPEAEAVPAAPAAPADDDPFKITTEGRLPARVWTDNTGEHRVLARLVEIREGKVRLLKDSGRTTTVPFARLSKEDREYVREAQTKFGQGQIGQVAAR